MTKTLCKSHQNDCCFVEGWDWLIFLNAYWCNLNICMLLRNAEWVQIGVMKPFHYGDEQCWINRNSRAQCFMEPAVALWHRVLLCLQLCRTAQAWRWLLQTRENKNKNSKTTASDMTAGSACRYYIPLKWTFLVTAHTTATLGQPQLWAKEKQCSKASFTCIFICAVRR